MTRISRRRSFLRCLAPALGFLLVGGLAGPAQASSSPQAAAAADRLTPVTQSVPTTPRWYRADDGRWHLSYELRLTNAVSLPVTVTSVQVRGAGGRRLATLSGSRLAASMSLLGGGGAPPTLPASTVGIVWLDLAFASRQAIPARLEHRLTVDVGPGLPVGPILTDTGGRATVARRGPVTIAPPVAGGRWALVASAHRRGLLPVNGALRLGQRFAIDFSARLDASGRTHTGPSNRNASYFNYGQPLLAVAAGTVITAVDGLPDQIPNENRPVSLAKADGNHVILRLAPGVYAGYAHLEPGSLRVRRGDRVRPGQVLGRLGNSGNTSGPHLHFQLMTRPSLLDADGLPFVVDRFRLDGHVPSLDTLIDTDREGTPVPIEPAGAGPRRGVGFTELGVVSFADRSPR
ncbi:MAG: M23 family metallopeptidase [Solirubrobacteraceae bacterium]